MRNRTIKILGTLVACVTYDSAMEIVQRLAREPRPVISRAAVPLSRDFPSRGSLSRHLLSHRPGAAVRRLAVY